MTILNSKNIQLIYKLLDKKYPKEFDGLNFSNEFQILIATILSAQCTDERVNKVTAQLFEKVESPEDILELGHDLLKKAIKSCGLYNTKAKNIYKTSQILVEDYNSVVPKDIKLLQKLPGVGRKTANVVFIEGFKIPRMPVDTHVMRVSNRLKIVDEKTVLKTEKKLMERVPEHQWIRMHHLLIFHGRNICKARNPKCEKCCLNDMCNFYIEGDENEKNR